MSITEKSLVRNLRGYIYLELTVHELCHRFFHGNLQYESPIITLITLLIFAREEKLGILPELTNKTTKRSLSNSFLRWIT